MRKIILASASPRRSELLSQADIEFEVCPSKVEEMITKTVPSEIVMDLALQKAMDVAESELLEDDSRIVLGADTVVVCDGNVLGKPKDAKEAKEMLSMLSAYVHQVYTGVCMVSRKNGQLCPETFYEKTDVTMYPLSMAQIDWYISTGEYKDKAGAYGIQGRGAVLVRSISGDYNNVVGLPLSKVWRYLNKPEML